MASTLTRFWYHLVFSTKVRQNLISSELSTELYSYIGGIIRGEKGHLLTIGGTANHLHLLTSLHPSISVSEMMKRIKGHSSKWVNEKPLSAGHFSWQAGYGAFTVSESLIEKVSTYIKQQEEHHRKISFEEEYRQLLEKHHVAYEEKYLWD